MSTEYTKNFSMLPNEVMEIDHKVINSTAKLVYSIIYTMLNSNDEFFMSNKSIAKKIGNYQPNAVPTLLKQLIDYGLITTRLAKSDNNQVIGRYIKLSNLYKKEAVKKSTGVVKKTVEGSQENIRGYSENHKRGSQKNVSKYISNNRLSNRLNNNTVKNDFDNESIDQKNKSKKITTQNKQAREDFEKLWKLYPKKKGKSKSFNYYVKAINDGVTNKEIQDGILNYVKDLKIKGTTNQYIKQGSTYFSERSWEDELDMQPNGNVRETVPDWINNDNYEPPKQHKKEVDMSKLEERLARRQANADN